MRRDADNPGDGRPEPMADGRQWIVWTAATAAFLGALVFWRAALTDDAIDPVLRWVGVAAACSALAGALSGAFIARLGVGRASKVRAWDRFTWGTCFASATVGLISVLAPPGDVTQAGVLAAAGFGAVTGTVAQFLLHGSSPTYYYALAILRQRRGDRDGACEAIGSYLLICHKDPDSATRRPIAERFLRDAGTSLQVPTELLAAEAPAGRGTEPEHAPAPPGRGTEMEHAPQPEGIGLEREGR